MIERGAGKTDRRYLAETNRMRGDLLRLWNLGLLFTLCLLAVSGAVAVIDALGISLVLLLCVFLHRSDSVMLRLLWIAPNLVLSSLYHDSCPLSEWSLSDEFLLLFPSFLVSNVLHRLLHCSASTDFSANIRW